MYRLILLIITRNYENNVVQGFNYLMDELAKITNVMVWYELGNIHATLQRLPLKPDLIILNEHGSKGPEIQGLSDLSIPTVAYLHDLHCKTEKIKNSIRRDKIGYIFSIIRDKFCEWFPEFISIAYWLPHHVNPLIFDDYNLQRDLDYLLMGNTYKRIYPLRHTILRKMKASNQFSYHPHYGYSIDKAIMPHCLGKDYADEINRAKIFFTCDSIYQYPVQKYFEVLACKTLLLAPSSQELVDLGFIAGVHYVEIDDTNFKQQAEYYLHNENERLKIAEQGYQMVHANHTTPIRAAQLVEMIENILSELYD